LQQLVSTGNHREAQHLAPQFFSALPREIEPRLLLLESLLGSCKFNEAGELADNTLVKFSKNPLALREFSRYYLAINDEESCMKGSRGPHCRAESMESKRG
jgi:hypothetical protein